MAILTETDSRPGLIGYEETNKPLYSEIETEKTKQIMKEYEQKPRDTILDFTLNDIVDNTVTMVGDFTKDYIMKVHEVNLEEELYGEDEESYINNFKKYIIAFMLYLSDKNNLLYFGIILVILSIILYFFYISSQ